MGCEDERESDAPGGRPAERLREVLEERFGEVPPESPTEPDEPTSSESEEEATEEDPERGEVSERLDDERQP